VQQCTFATQLAVQADPTLPSEIRAATRDPQPRGQLSITTATTTTGRGGCHKTKRKSPHP
jgi:hypothetical protein